MIAGDMVAGKGTILVEPQDGDMEAYLASLQQMAGYEPSVLIPAHGGPIDDAVSRLEHYHAHRLRREAKVLGALSNLGRAATASELVPQAYDDAPKSVWPLAALSVEAHLIKLVRDGVVRRDGGGWAL
jgi:glyoxylase-like metal-dependent hydrolase (beta-lactamase superfamily II)